MLLLLSRSLAFASGHSIHADVASSSTSTSSSVLAVREALAPNIISADDFLRHFRVGSYLGGGFYGVVMSGELANPEQAAGWWAGLPLDFDFFVISFSENGSQTTPQM